MEGNSYKIKAGIHVISEYLALNIVHGNLVYTATVVNQNDGKPGSFTLNKSVTKKLSFENPAHDFPKKIQYTKMNESTIFVEVLGYSGKGFSYKMTKSK